MATGDHQRTTWLARRKDAKSRTGGRKLVMLMARPIPRADLKKQESRWACRRSGSSHVSVGLTGLLNPT